MRLRRAPLMYEKTCSTSSAARRVYRRLKDPGSPRIARISSSVANSPGSGSNEEALEDSSSLGVSHTVDGSFSAHWRRTRASASCVSGGSPRKISTACSRSSVTAPQCSTFGREFECQSRACVAARARDGRSHRRRRSSKPGRQQVKLGAVGAARLRLQMAHGCELALEAGQQLALGAALQHFGQKETAWA
jgi:hypothetical protein